MLRIEKAARELVTPFLRVMDDGRLTDGQGRVVEFCNKVIIMTSNLGAAYRRGVSERERIRRARVVPFPPEFVNRVDEIIVFLPLGRHGLNAMQIIPLARMTTFDAARGTPARWTSESICYGTATSKFEVKLRKPVI